jgi:hypothetical protein
VRGGKKGQEKEGGDLGGGSLKFRVPGLKFEEGKKRTVPFWKERFFFCI